MSMSASSDTERLLRQLQATRTVVEHGRVVQAGGTVLRATGLRARIGQQCRVFDPVQGPGPDALLAEVIGFAGAEVILAPYGPLQGVAVCAAVQALADAATVPCGPALLGRVIDPFGRPLDARPLTISPSQRTALYADAPSPLQRRGVDDALATGVRAIDAALTVGEGQRVGIFAMAGGGKSTLLGMLARQARADVNVIALVGERGLLGALLR
jgi:ATP synthase in type III secretion protein N